MDVVGEDGLNDDVEAVFSEVLTRARCRSRSARDTSPLASASVNASENEQLDSIECVASVPAASSEREELDSFDMSSRFSSCLVACLCWCILAQACTAEP